MSELKEALWSVLSERGCEASRLSYAAAAQLVAQLAREPVYGLCIITDEAAARTSFRRRFPTLDNLFPHMAAPALRKYAAEPPGSERNQPPRRGRPQ